jgi:hypothetical protein
MIIDNPRVMRELIEETRPYFTHLGAEEIYTTRSHQMDAYAKHFAELADPVWQNEYIKAQDKLSNKEKKNPFENISLKFNMICP